MSEGMKERAYESWRTSADLAADWGAKFAAEEVERALAAELAKARYPTYPIHYWGGAYWSGGFASVKDLRIKDLEAQVEQLKASRAKADDLVIASRKEAAAAKERAWKAEQAAGSLVHNVAGGWSWYSIKPPAPALLAEEVAYVRRSIDGDAALYAVPEAVAAKAARKAAGL